MATLAACSAARITANAAAIQRAHRESALADPQPVPGSGASRQQASITIEAITVTDLVRLLDAWRRRQPAWALTAVRLEYPAAESADTASRERATAMLSFEKLVLSGTPSSPVRTPSEAP